MKKLLLSLIIVRLSFAAQVWDVSGHMIVAQIAFERLNDNAKKHVKELAAQLELNNKPLNEVNVAAWADEIKHQHGGPFGGHYKNWHFIDLGCAGDENPGPDLLNNPPKMSIQNGDLVTALNNCVAVIKDHKQDPLIPHDFIALALIMHLVGDIHQPLHCSTHYFAQKQVEPGHVRPEQSDAGGNAITLSNFHNQFPELHQFWDVAYKTDFSGNTITSGTDLVVADTAPDTQKVKDFATNMKAFAPSSSTSLQPNFHDWAVETHNLGCADGYAALHSDPEAIPKALDSTYAKAAKDIACKQICLAGFRLAELLNQLYGAQ